MLWIKDMLRHTRPAGLVGLLTGAGDVTFTLARRNGGLKASNLWRPGRFTGRMYGSTLWSAGIGFDLGVPSDLLYQQVVCE